MTVPPCVFVFSGEGAHSADTDISVLKFSTSWPAVQRALHELGHDPEAFLQQNLGEHSAPNSPVVTVALNILNADLWRQWGVVPSLVLGHSVGEIAAAYTAGIFTAEQALSCAHHLGLAMQGASGVMLHTELPRSSLAQFPADGLHVAAVNYVVRKAALGLEAEDLLSVTLCGLGDAADAAAYLAKDPAATVLKPPHAWHHPEAPRTSKAARRFLGRARPG
jgi:acyl transferase domain-containing protein